MVLRMPKHQTKINKIMFPHSLDFGHEWGWGDWVNPLKKKICDENLSSDNDVEWGSQKSWKMIFANVKTNVRKIIRIAFKTWHKIIQYIKGVYFSFNFGWYSIQLDICRWTWKYVSWEWFSSLAWNYRVFQIEVTFFRSKLFQS